MFICVPIGPTAACTSAGATCVHQSGAVCGRRRYQLHRQHDVRIISYLTLANKLFTFPRSLLKDLTFLFHLPSSRSGAFPYTDTALYTQTTAGQYYEGQATSGTQASTPGTPLTVSVTTGTTGAVSMFVAQPSSATGGGTTVVSTGGTTNGSGDGAGTNGGATGSYVIQGGYMLGSSSSSSSGGSSGNSQSYAHTARASPATVSITEGEESSVPSADKKVCRGSKRRNFLSFCFHLHNPLAPCTERRQVESTIKNAEHCNTTPRAIQSFCRRTHLRVLKRTIFLTVISSSKKTNKKNNNKS